MPEACRRLTVVVPLYDEAANVAALGHALTLFLSEEGATRVVDFVLVDDGSRDDTHARLQELARALPAEVLRHAHNRGLTAALDSGLRAARGELIAWLDSDLTYPPSLLGELARACDAGADMALASCYHPQGGVEGVPRWRLLVSRAASTGHRLTSGSRLHTFTSMVRVFRREVLDDCRPARGGFVGVTEILLRALRRGYRAVEVPAVLRRRRAGVSKMRVARVALGHLGLMWANVTGRLCSSAPPRPASAKDQESSASDS
ncbi:MAG: glycosyltransferase [Planctomycetota bacterium]